MQPDFWVQWVNATYPHDGYTGLCGSAGSAVEAVRLWAAHNIREQRICSSRQRQPLYEALLNGPVKARVSRYTGDGTTLELIGIFTVTLVVTEPDDAPRD